MIEIVPATQKLVETYYGGKPAYSMRGVVALEDGIPVGLGGLMVYQGKTYMFCEMKDCARKYRKSILKAGKQVLKLAKGKIVYAVAQDGIESAPRFLEHLGFQLLDNDKKLYVKR